MMLAVSHRTNADGSTMKRKKTTMANQNEIEEIQARLSIQRALDNYGFGMDMHDMERWLSTWHEDAVYDVDHPRRVCHGHADMKDWVQQVWDQFAITNHFTTNHIIDFESSTTATGIGKGAVMFVMADGAYVTGAAIFHDKYEKRNNVWRISYRKVDVNHLAQINGASVTQHPAEQESQS